MSGTEIYLTRFIIRELSWSQSMSHDLCLELLSKLLLHGASIGGFSCMAKNF